ncbi:MAG: hypothetical protein GTO45_34940, partial [Candidatus Aminicenantes bacterium]|nr:hypothetical protein [Candidatus Aminicenantes bacterium]NIM83890.1 hypothetical protein [Candidatus Aminicenantes bacterium]NIN23354.1 hypothetical protein [Candidatus Aminicenantes bacterium]NIN47056.1 hypothetical protein [Candidatus Aminicenantes bacterium]NIN89980.1 hypothetical protein [Candidatus Aminicenantes bacterium]
MKLIEHLQHLLIPTRLKRTIFFLLFDIVLIAFSFFLSFYLRFGFSYPAKYRGHFLIWLGIIAAIKITTLALFQVYQLNWRFVSIIELGNILKSGLISTAVLYGFNLVIRYFWGP